MTWKNDSHLSSVKLSCLIMMILIVREKTANKIEDYAKPCFKECEKEMLWKFKCNNTLGGYQYLMIWVTRWLQLSFCRWKTDMFLTWWWQSLSLCLSFIAPKSQDDFDTRTVESPRLLSFHKSINPLPSGGTPVLMLASN